MAKPDKKMAKKIVKFWNQCNVLDPEWIDRLSQPSVVGALLLENTPSVEYVVGEYSTGHTEYLSGIGGFLNGLIEADDDCRLYIDSAKFLHVKSKEEVEDE